MRFLVVNISVCLAVLPAPAHLRVYAEEVDGLAWIKYECTTGELVRAFALVASVDQGRILRISDYFVGESRPGARGYGIFPGTFRDHVILEGGEILGWDQEGYSQLAVVADSPSDTLPGLNSSGVTLELGGLWDPNVPNAAPPTADSLCALWIRVILRNRGGTNRESCVAKGAHHPA